MCVNQLRELGTATIHYESVKGQLPGYTNRAPLDGAKQISWVIALFPYLDREDLWSEWRDGDGPIVQVDLVCCPSDQGNLVNNAPLNYVANNLLFLDRSTTAKANANSRTLEGLQSTQQTVMFSERAYSDSYPVGPWNSTGTLNYLTFGWPNEDDSSETVTIYTMRTQTNGISSNHPGLVNVGFADGHVETLAEDSMTDVFRCGKD